MNTYKVNIFADQNVSLDVPIEAEKVEVKDGVLRFMVDDIVTAEFMKWQFWKYEGRMIPPKTISF